MATLPKLRDVVEAESCRTEAMLVPDKGIVSGEVGELFVSARLA